MTEKIKLLAIINPISGTGKQKNIEALLNSNIDHNRFLLSIKKTEFAGHAKDIAKEAISKYDAVLAIGGDGTINEIASSLVGSTVIMGIIPCGSGNGLARHIGIPMNSKSAIKWLNTAVARRIDSISINNNMYVCVAGVGFDAYVSHKFAEMDSRGLISYAKATMSSFFAYKEEEFIIEFNNKIIKGKAMMLSIANSSQFGNNAYVAPNASLSDGLVNLVLIRKPKIYQIPMLAFKMFTKRLNSSSLCKQYISDTFKITHSNDKAHTDGEPIFIDKHVRIITNKNSLSIFTHSDV